MNYSAIKNFDVANGTGYRVTLFVSGCRNHCEGCFQPETWDFSHGRPYTKETEDRIMGMASHSHISGLTILGGDPLEPENQKPVADLVERFKKQHPGKNVWLYTGYVLEEIKAGRNWTEDTARLLNYTDILIDGPFILGQKDLSLKFRGSRNQRMIRNPGYENFEILE